MGKPKAVLALLVILSLVLGTGSFALKWWSRGKSEIKVETLRVIEGSRWVYYLPMYIAQQQGFFKEQKLVVKLTTAQSKDAVMPALSNGKADIALTGLENAIYDHALGRGKPVAFAALTRRNESFLLARSETTGFQWTDLKGKSVITGVPESRECLILEGLLRQHGVAPHRQVSLFTNIPDNLKTGAFKSGTGTFLQVAEPIASELEAEGVGKVVASLGVAAGDYPAAVYLTSSSFLNSHPDALQRFTSAIYKAQLWLQHHGAGEAATVVRKSFKKQNNNLVLKSIERYHSQQTWSPNPVIARVQFHHLQEIMQEAGEIADTVEYNTAVEPRFAEKAVQTVQYIPEDKKPKRKFPLNIYDAIVEKIQK